VIGGMCCVERAVSRGFSLKDTSGGVWKPSMSSIVFVLCVWQGLCAEGIIT